MEDSDDHMRPRYLAQHIHQMWRAVNFNWPVKGYFHWTLVDNFEWERGWTQRFGLWALDVETQKRTKRPSADLYAEICKENGLSSEMVQKYCPEVFDNCSLSDQVQSKGERDMDFKTQLTGLNELLAVIYGDEMQLDVLFGELGFEQSQIEQLADAHLQSVVPQFLEVIHKRLTSDSGKDTYYQILSRRYGLDGEPRAQLSAIAEMHGFSPEYLRPLFEEIMQRCQSKTWQAELKTSLKYIAVASTGKDERTPCA